MSDIKFDIDANKFPSLTWHRLNINNGHFSGAFAASAAYKLPDLPEGVTSSLQEDAGSVFENIETQLGSEFDNLITRSYKELGGKILSLTVPEGCICDKPVKISFDIKNGERLLSDIVINAGENSSSTFILDYSYSDEGNEESSFGSRVRIFAGENSKVKIITVNLLGKKCLHFNGVGSKICDNALVDVVQLELGGSEVFSGYCQDMTGYSSKSLGHQAYMVGSSQMMDINYVARQKGRLSDSQIITDGVVDIGGKKTWRGTIDFKNGCTDSKGDEQENVLLLGDEDGENQSLVNKSLPVILCDEEDVEGRHGCSIGRLSPEILFYMQSRGLDEDAARAILVQAKFNSICRYIPDSELVERINNYISGR